MNKIRHCNTQAGLSVKWELSVTGASVVRPSTYTYIHPRNHTVYILELKWYCFSLVDLSSADNVVHNKKTELYF